MNPDPRCNFYSEKKQRLNNKSLYNIDYLRRSDYVDNSLLNFVGGPLNVIPKTSQINFPNQKPLNSNEIKSDSPMQKYASLLLSQREI